MPTDLRNEKSECAWFFDGKQVTDWGPPHKSPALPNEFVTVQLRTRVAADAPPRGQDMREMGLLTIRGIPTDKIEARKRPDETLRQCAIRLENTLCKEEFDALVGRGTLRGVHGIEVENAELRERIAELTAQRDALVAAVTAHQQEIARLQAKVGEMGRERLDLQAALDAQVRKLCPPAGTTCHRSPQEIAADVARIMALGHAKPAPHANPGKDHADATNAPAAPDPVPGHVALVAPRAHWAFAPSLAAGGFVALDPEDE